MNLTIALAGNPNCGKTTMFNKLTGSSQRVGNWPGVTVDKKVGKIKDTDGADLVDLPGIYSLSPYSPEEIVSRNYLVEERPDAILNIVDATNLERNLYLTLQLIDTGIPTVIALNMMDAVEKLGDTIDTKKMSKALGCPVVPVSALKGTGIDEMVAKVVETAKSKKTIAPVNLGKDLEDLISITEEALKGKVSDQSLRFHAIKLIENDDAVVEKLGDVRESVSGEIEKVEVKHDDEIDSLVADARYNAISGLVADVVTKGKRDPEGTFSDKIDRIVTHRILGIPIFFGVLALLFLGIIGYGDFVGIGTYCTDWLNEYIGTLMAEATNWCQANGVNEILASLLVDGIIGGVGAVIGFLPQMLILFLGLCILEDIGYMSRIAFVMDRVFRYFGLSGKSLIPVLVGTGCGVPGIMASRTIESDRDRRITAMTVTFIPCGAKLPVIAMIAGAIFGGDGLVAIFSYILGITCILISGIILKKWKGLAGEPSPFIMELPPYHLPSWFGVLKETFNRGWAFVKNAGTIILLSCVVLWALMSFDTSFNWIGANSTSESILQSIGEIITVIFIPLGWGDEWQLTVGTITGLIAKENIVGTFGVLFGFEEIGEEGEEIWNMLGSIINKAEGLSFLAFNLLCAPCFAAIGAMRREFGTWKMTLMAVGYQCALAYVVSLILYAFLSLMWGYEVNTVIVVTAIILTALIVYLLWAKDPFKIFDNIGKKVKS